MTTEQKRARALELRGEGMTIREIAADLEVSVNTAHRYVNEKSERKQLRRNREYLRRKRQEETARS